ncbi:hypothetical protein D3C72_1944060 [compost metagenome]
MPWQPMHMETLSRAFWILPTGAASAAKAWPAIAQDAMAANTETVHFREVRNFIGMTLLGMAKD